jgi:ABC-type branched-subunit amino acid transport system substrate-binding protein
MFVTNNVITVRNACYEQTEFDGLSGKITLDENGERTNFELDVIQLEESGFVPVTIGFICFLNALRS